MRFSTYCNDLHIIILLKNDDSNIANVERDVIKRIQLVHQLCTPMQMYYYITYANIIITLWIERLRNSCEFKFHSQRLKFL